MAHNLLTIDGRTAMAYATETPWHKLGTRTPGMTDVATALTAANLDWLVSRHPVFMQDGRKVPNTFAIQRDHPTAPAILGSVGPQFRPVQNAEAFGILTDVCKDFGVTIETAGALGQGERTWMLAKMPEAIEPVPGDKVNGYFLVTNGHDGSLSYGARLTPIRVVCQNTLNAATSSSKPQITIRHTIGAAKRIEEAKRMIERLHSALKQTGETYATLAARKMTRLELAAFVAAVFPADPETGITDRLRDKRDTVSALVKNGIGAEYAPDSAWTAYNAVTEYIDHVRPAEAKSFNAKQSAREAAIFGGGELVKLRALVAARQLVAA